MNIFGLSLATRGAEEDPSLIIILVNGQYGSTREHARTSEGLRDQACLVSSRLYSPHGFPPVKDQQKNFLQSSAQHLARELFCFVISFFLFFFFLPRRYIYVCIVFLLLDRPSFLPMLV